MGESEASAGTAQASTSLVASHLANLVPTFNPATDDLKAYSQKVQLLLRMWPEGKYTELATRLILGCSGSAFDKLQLNSDQITGNDKKSIQKLIELLGGQWGQIPLERKYEAAERALFKCIQKSDETNDSFLARADVMWQELKNQAMNLEELQAYITLRGSALAPDDKKRVILDSEGSTDGKLTITKVSQAVRMLGAGFFQELVAGKKVTKLKTYGNDVLLAEEDDDPQASPAETGDEIPEEQIMDTLMEEGDDDACLVSEFENAAMDVIQSDNELASAYTAYTEARRRLSEKVKSRGFWPIGKGKGKTGSRFSKGKFSKGHSSSLPEVTATTHS